MTRPRTTGPRITWDNHLLASIPPAEASRVRALTERVRPRMREVLYEQAGPMPYVYFPEGGLFSLLTEMRDGSCIESLTIGNEGLIGLPLLLGATRSPTRVICQVSGQALRLPAAAFLEAVVPGTALFGRLARYAQALMTSLGQSVACNRLHTAAQRYARWILVTHDRVGLDEVPITQDFLAQMLGVSRQTVSETATAFQDAGLIHYTQGRVTVDDRAGLEAAACECYGVVRAAFDTLLGASRG
jgi:CRP-like cAMP-binding protein